jgi:hypothetical protein
MLASSVWEGLLLDLVSSCERCRRTLATITDPGLQEHSRRARERLQRIAEGVAAALDADPSLEPDFATVAAFAGPFDYVRRVLLPFLVHYGPDERYLTGLVRRIAADAELAISWPIVGTFSTRGYWVSPWAGTLCVPSGEHGQLLTFPDLVHEIAHILLDEHGSGLMGSFVAQVIGPYTQALGPVRGDAHFGSRLHAQYQAWFAEFAADVIATFVCGPAFGWQHLRLRAQSADERVPPWQPAEPASDDAPTRFTHPADSARTAVIALALEHSGHPLSARRLRTEWQALCAGALPEPVTYAPTYGDDLLTDLVRITLDWCQAQGITVFNASKKDAVVRVIDQAWELQLAQPAAFAANEETLLAHLRALVEDGP